MPPGTVVGQAFIAIHADTAAVPGEIKAGVAGGAAAAEKEVKGTTTGLSSLARAAAGGLILGETAKVLKGFADAAAASNREGRITAQIIANTGDAARVTKGHVDNLARSISLKTGIDRDQIHAAENVLLGFTQIQNAGKGQAAIFDRVTHAAADLHTVMGTDVVGAAKLLGKALADPEKGLLLLRRAGVVLGPTLQDQIKHLGDVSTKVKEVGKGHAKHAEVVTKYGKTISDNNKLLQAQRLLLGQIEGRYGGTAAAAASSGARLKAQIADLKITFGQALLPTIKVINTVLGSLLDHFNHLPGPVKAIVPILGLFAGAAVGVGLIVKPLGEGLKALGLVVKLVSSETLLAAGPWILLAAAIGIAVFLIIKHWDTIKAALLVLKDAFFAALDFIKGLWNDVVSWIRDHAELIKVVLIGLITGGLGLLVLGFIQHFDRIKGIVGDAVGFIEGALGRVRDGFLAMVEFIASVPGRIASLIGHFFQIGRDIIDAIVHGIESAGSAILNAIKNLIPGPIRGLLGKVGGFVGGLFSFQQGGVVPGPIGAPQLAIVHGGEQVVRHEDRGTGGVHFGPGSIVVSFEGGGVPTTAQAFGVGQAVGHGISDALLRRQIRQTARGA